MYVWCHFITWSITDYRIIIADITNATKHLDPAYSDKSPSPERDTAEAENSQQFLTTQEAQAAIICDLSLLPNVMAASRSVKGVSYCSSALLLMWSSAAMATKA